MTMKKALIASTALALSAGFASADVTISGYGRFGVQYQENRGGENSDENETQIISRLRLNIDASTATDQGLEFGGRMRLQYDQGEEGASESPAYLYVTSNALTVYVGNVPTAFDEAGLVYGMELGAYDYALEPWGPFFAFDTDGYGDGDQVGVTVEYAIDSLTLRASYVDPDQSGENEDSTLAIIDNPSTIDVDETGVLIADVEEEISIAADYVWNEKLELSGSYVTNGAGIDGNDHFFVGARYAVLDNARIGLNYYSADLDEFGDTVYLYGDYTLADGNTNIEAFIANNDGDGDLEIGGDDPKETDTFYGIGVNYDLGGARLGASLQRDLQENMYADMGVRFDF